MEIAGGVRSFIENGDMLTLDGNATGSSDVMGSGRLSGNHSPPTHANMRQNFNTTQQVDLMLNSQDLRT